VRRGGVPDDQHAADLLGVGMLANVDGSGVIRLFARMALSNGEAGAAFPEPVGEVHPAPPY